MTKVRVNVVWKCSAYEKLLKRFPKIEIYRDSNFYYIDLKNRNGASKYPKDHWSLDAALQHIVDYETEDYGAL